MFWASKMHFHLTSPQFYNFPYTFGYLFALGVYAQQVPPPPHPPGGSRTVVHRTVA